MSKKYIYANIRLPIELSANGSFSEVFTDRMTIDFELCKTLPEPTSYENKELIAKIIAIHQPEPDSVKNEEPTEQEQEPDEGMNIFKKEFKHKMNMSFRRRLKTKNPNKFTRRTYT
jgi:hypothetical protein